MLFDRMIEVDDVQPVGKLPSQRRSCQLALILVLLAGPASAGVLGLDVGLDLDLGGGLHGGGIGVDAGVGVGGIGVDASVGIGGGAGGHAGPGQPGGPGGPGAGPVTEAEARARVSGGGGMACARDANETGYNGYVVRDRKGDTVGWVHGATVTPEGRVLALRMQSASRACYKLSGGRFRFSGGEVWANVDAAAFR